VPPLSRFVVGTQAVLAMPRDAAGSLWIRSSYARRGVLASFGKVDAGFRGNLTVGAFHAGHEELQVPIGDRFCQLVLETLHTPPAAPAGAPAGSCARTACAACTTSGPKGAASIPRCGRRTCAPPSWTRTTVRTRTASCCPRPPPTPCAAWPRACRRSGGRG